MNARDCRARMKADSIEPNAALWCLDEAEKIAVMSPDTGRLRGCLEYAAAMIYALNKALPEKDRIL